MKLRPKDTADVCLLLEGTYPFVRGGVSSWVHQIIRNMSEFTFSLVFLGGSRSDYGEMRYELPENVVHLETHYLSEAWQVAKAQDIQGRRERFADSSALHDYFREPEKGLSKDLMKRVLDSLGARTGITREDFLFSRASWENISSDYRQFCSHPSFVDYFWTVRIMHAPLFTLAEVAKKTPKARCYHSISTGYAGLLAVFLNQRYGRPFILSEHGIYTKERKIELAQADWIKDAEEVFGGGLNDDISYIRRLWIRFFEGIGRITYEAADPIVSLYEGNRQRQLQDGAEASRTMIVPNGIDMDRFAPLRSERTDKVPLVAGLIGRIVPIKDVKTFIRAMHTVVRHIPEAEGWLVGPEDEDPNYARECHELVKSLDLDDRVKFLGFQNVAKILPQLGLIVLSSISEALPLVVVEGYAAGVPAVVTDVGSCRELIDGSTEEDKALGSSGTVVPIADPGALGMGIVDLLGDEERWRSAQAAAIKRVERFYDQKDMVRRYREIYEKAVHF